MKNTHFRLIVGVLPNNFLRTLSVINFNFERKTRTQNERELRFHSQTPVREAQLINFHLKIKIA